MKANYRVTLTKAGIEKPITWVFMNKSYKNVQMLIKEYVHSQHHECNYIIEEIK